VKPFAYQAPTTLGEAIALLSEKGDRARPLAGGTDLLVRLRLGALDVDTVVDVKGIPELNELQVDSAQGLTIGAAVPCCRIYEHAQVASTYPCLADAVSLIGGMAIQGRATVGGNLCNASPSGDALPALIVLGATCSIAGPAGQRTLPVEEFCLAPGRTALGWGELLVSLHLPPPQPGMGARYLRFIPRGEMDIAVVGVGAALVLSADGATIASARLALGAVAPTPLLLPAVGDALAGRPPGEEAWARAADLAAAAARPISDVRGSARLRQHLVGVLTRRALRGAMRRARGGRDDVQE
jgi:CO/xanthine dehydrogenase FAD-binding subunit